MLGSLKTICSIGPRYCAIGSAFYTTLVPRVTPFSTRLQNTQICLVYPPIIQHSPKPAMVSTLTYPKVARNEDQIDNLFGHQVADQYRALEDPSDATLDAFVKAQNAVTDKYLEETCKNRSQVRERLTKIWNFERYSCPSKHGDYYYYFHNTGLQPQSVLYVQKELKGGKADVFLDPNTLSEDGTVALGSLDASKSGKYMAYSLSASGSDWVTIQYKTTPQVTESASIVKEGDSEIIKWCKFTGMEWTHDDRGFFYQRYPAPDADADPGHENSQNEQHMTYYHVRGTPQSEDKLVFKAEDPKHVVGSSVSHDGKYLLISVHPSCEIKNNLYVTPLEADKSFKGQLKLQTITEGFDASYNYIANQGSIFYFETNKNAPRSKIVKFDLENPSQGFTDVLPEQEGVIERVGCVRGNILVISILQNVTSRLALLDLNNPGSKLEHIKIEGDNNLTIDSIISDPDQDFFFFRAVSFQSPGTIYHYKFNNDKTIQGNLEVFRKTELSVKLDKKVVVEQKWYKSKDGTDVPMFIFRPASHSPKPGNKVPCLLYGYGGFGISMSPRFSVSWNTWVHAFDGIVAVANLRGGGEFGEENWHLQGVKHKKQNVFDDFIYASKALEEMGYTTAEHIASMGGSNGGLLVAATANQAPDRFGAVVCQVGVLDMLRFHKFTIGYLWKSDYGDPDVKEDFEYLYKYSPYHTIPTNKDVKYPAMLLTTADHDDRVAPLHSFKFISRLQHLRGNVDQTPHIIRIEAKAGHGAGKPTAKAIEEATDMLAFMACHVGATWDV